jgi:hypothetical protein
MFQGRIEAALGAADGGTPSPVDFFTSVTILGDIRGAVGHFAALPTEKAGHASPDLATRHAIASSVARRRCERIVADTERVAAMGLQALVTARDPGSPAMSRAARVTASAIDVALRRIDALLPAVPPQPRIAAV